MRTTQGFLQRGIPGSGAIILIISALTPTPGLSLVMQIVGSSRLKEGKSVTGG